jgi:hypothetical protein
MLRVRYGPAARLIQVFLVALWSIAAEGRALAGPDEQRVTILFDKVLVNRLAPGVTFGVKVDDTPQTDNELTRDILKRSTAYQNQHIVGWGGWYARDLTLDIGLLQSLVDRMPGPDKIITLCCALPDQRVDPGDLESRPRADALDAFASMAGDVAARFAGRVAYYQVWNEMKGFWLESAGRWDSAAYCDLYNRVYDRVKRADPTASVGGPYVVIDVDASGAAAEPGNRNNFQVATGIVDGRDIDVVDDWLKCARTPDGGLKGDFLVIDVRNFNRQSTWAVDPFKANRVFEEIAAHLRARIALDYPTLPIWAAEWYSTSPSPLAAAQSAALHMSAMRSLSLGGYARAPLWYPEGDGDGLHDKQGVGTMGLWTGEGAAATRLAAYFEQFKSAFPPGRILYQVNESSGEDVQVLAGETTTMLINTQADARTVTVNQTRLVLQPYEVVFVDTATLKNSFR